MKYFFLALLISAPVFAANHMIVMKSMSFDPKEITIKAGDTLQWDNKAYTNHAANFADKSLDTELVTPGHKSKEVKFDKPGIYPYECRIHGSSMRGKVTVQ